MKEETKKAEKIEELPEQDLDEVAGGITYSGGPDRPPVVHQPIQGVDVTIGKKKSAA